MKFLAYYASVLRLAYSSSVAWLVKFGLLSGIVLFLLGLVLQFFLAANSVGPIAQFENRQEFFRSDIVGVLIPLLIGTILILIVQIARAPYSMYRGLEEELNKQVLLSTDLKRKLNPPKFHHWRPALHRLFIRFSEHRTVHQQHVSIDVLRDCGLGKEDLREMLDKGYIQCAVRHDRNGHFDLIQKNSFDTNAVFWLTEAGAEWSKATFGFDVGTAQ